MIISEKTISELAQVQKSYKTVWVRCGDILKKLSRFCYQRDGRVCFVCGSRCGFDSIFAEGRFWCTKCYVRYLKPYKHWDTVNDYIWDWRGLGRRKK